MRGWNLLPVLLDLANERNFFIQNICYRTWFFQNFALTTKSMAKTAGLGFPSIPTIKTALADFLGHPTSRADADALRASAWLSP